MKKKVLLLSHFMPPMGGGAVHRNVRIIKFLHQLGWSLYALTTKKHTHPNEEGKVLLELIDKKISFWYTQTFDPLTKGRERFKKIKKTNLSDGKEIERKFRGVEANILTFLKKTFGHIWHGLAVPDIYAGWIPFALSAGKKHVKVEGIDVILSTSPLASDHLLGALLKRKTNIPLVIDLHDPWTQRRLFDRHTGLRQYIERKMEKFVIHQADLIIVTTEPMKDYLVKIYPESQCKIIVIENGYDPDDFSKVDDLSGQSKMFSIIHTGNLNGSRTGLYFLRAIQEILNEKKISRKELMIEFIGEVEEKSQQFVFQHSMDDVVKILPGMTHQSILKKQASSSALLLVTDPRGKIQTPLKMFEYLHIKKPVIALVPDGICKDILNETNAGWIADFSNVPEIKKAILDAYFEFKSGKISSWNKVNVEKYNMKTLMKKVDNRILALLKGGHL